MIEKPKPENLPADKQESYDPEKASEELLETFRKIEASKDLGLEIGPLLAKTVDLLKIVASSEDIRHGTIFRDNPLYKNMGIGSKYTVRNSLDRDLHRKILSYLKSLDIEISDQDTQSIETFFKEEDYKKRKAVFESYAQNGLLTLQSVIKKGLLKETSSTPGDFSLTEPMSTEDLEGESLNNIRGYKIDKGNVSKDLFYGRNSFFQVVLERGGEDIDGAARISKEEVENRLKNSLIFGIKTESIEILGRDDNPHKEDIVGRDIDPEELGYLIVSAENLGLATDVFKELPVKVIGADSTEVEEIYGLYEGPYSLPNYKESLNKVVLIEQSIWCHIARLPVETYPSDSN